MEDQLIGIHILAVCYLSLYGFLTKKSLWDYVYLFIVYATMLHWTFNNGECYINLRYKQLENPNYIAGQDTRPDIMVAFPEYAIYIRIFQIIQAFVVVVSVYFVYTRNHISSILYLPILILMLLYLARYELFVDCYQTSECILYEKVIQYCLIVYGIYLVWRLT
jgi:hypothetical protein